MDKWIFLATKQALNRLKLLVNTLDHIKVQIDSISAEKEAHKESHNRQQDPKPAQPVCVELHSPITVRVQEKTNKNGWIGPETREWIKLGLEVLGFAIQMAGGGGQIGRAHV